MSLRTQNDTVIDDDDEFCPLCIEEFDLSDKNFKPCPCGYQICQFCYNNINTHSEEGRCPNCRRIYDENTIQYRVPDADELKADLALKHRKAAAAKKKEQEKREIEASSRKNLAGVRVVQKNLVYVIGLNPTIRDESQLLQTLRGDQYFGQYGEIEKIVVSKAKPGGNPNQGIGVYVTFAKKSDAASCIAAVDGSANGDRVLRAQYGTTKYCSSFLRNEQCNNRNCTFLHETGEDSDSFSRQDLSSMNTMSSQRPHPSYPNVPGNQSRGFQQPNPFGPSSSLSMQQTKKDEGNRMPSNDAPALPSSASWANKESRTQRTRRPSMATSRGTPSPKPAAITIATKLEESKAPEKGPQQNDESSRQHTPTQGVGPSSGKRDSISPTNSLAASQDNSVVLDNLVKAINSPEFRFQFSPAGLSTDELAFIENHPSLIDPYGGVKRRAMRERAEQERAKQEAEAKMLLQADQPEEETLEAGSLQLGGEPEESHPGPGAAGRGGREPQAIQPPSQQATASNSAFGSPISAGHQFQSLNMNSRTLTPLQQQQLMLLKSANNQQGGLLDQLQTSSANGYDHNPLSRPNAFQNQMPPLSAVSGHARQSSRFSFANESNAKSSNHRLLSQQGTMMQASSPNPMTTPIAQHGLGSHFFTSGVQGPPPGLKTAGTPPVSGGGMFAQGHGFTSTMHNNLGLNAKQDGNADLMRDLMRARNGTSGGGVQSLEATKREYISSLIRPHNTPPPLAPVSGLLNSLYGPHTGLYQDPGPQKQKKRGKKHRHANTSSGGGGVVDLADPSILQARMHQNSATAVAGQGLYGSQGQVDEDFPPLVPPKTTRDDICFPSRCHISTASPISSFRSGTPTVPPGLSLPHGHPAASLVNESSVDSSPTPSKGHSSAQQIISPPPGLTPPQKFREALISKGDTPLLPESPARSKLIPQRDLVEVSTGSPKPKGNTPAVKGTQSPAPSKISKRSMEDAASTKTSKGREHHGKLKPIKLDISVSTSPRDMGSLPQSAVPYQLPALPTSITGSRPDTPGTVASRVSEPPVPRQPRVLRVVDTPKSETPPLQSSSAPSASTTTVKQRSRRPSVSSNSRPATPAEVSSEYDLYTSASASRANSPPPSRIGSAPVRVISKNQVRKQRKLKAEQTEAKKEEETTVTPAEDAVQAPIVGRKRKTRKPSKRTTDVSEDGSRTPSGVNEESPVETAVSTTPKLSEDTVKASPTVEKDEEEELPDEPWRTNNTLEQLMIDSEALAVSIKDLLLERTASLPTILAQLYKSGELDLHAHPLFNPPNLNQRVDMKCTADDYENLRRPIELTEEHRRMLLRGEPVRINAGSDLLKDRCLITPQGCILRHLSTEEEDHYLALEKTLTSAVDSGHEYPVFIVTEPDTTNRGGGLDALFATPEKFNIRWVDDEASRSGLITGTAEDSVILSHSSPQAPATTPPNVFSALEADSARTTNWVMPSGTDAMGAPLPPRSSATTKSIMTGSTFGVDLEELMNVSDQELRSMIEAAQRELELSRKDVDLVEKKVMALVKRNKKLVQQALAAALEFVASSDAKTPT
ncbi:transcriptional repressor general negative regulator of transcription subunit 4 [Emydomyces testavorans]|uniref:Transcriptional repressor general negative regulator of transcription subunit 4 n=1 Tax=Emydomyces testavorans TaxID=2070801 RepID=A0AAF0DHN9_9EURO|nr:transcriptional repressor general negative regulator of transcription subunit 4 [Emydomyces testavorans]